jgi:sterol desaturase/sphingolipid hydroxylase (fatty acid hydroxylase superfamily)
MNVASLSAAAWFVILLVLESARPLRASVSKKSVRIGRNVVLAATAFGIVALLQPPVLEAVARALGTHTLDLIQRRPTWLWSGARIVVSFLVLDYTLWIWHRLNHTVPFLWRFHRVHHVDRDLDVSTALRFHFGEFTLSVALRALQLALIGGDLALLGGWQGAVLASVLFHHSNVRLPERLDRLMTLLVVTPRMHGIHHSDVHAETDSNWSSLLSVWDRLHGTLRLDVAQERIRIGVPAYETEHDVRLARVLVLPFEAEHDDWLEKKALTR